MNEFKKDIRKVWEMTLTKRMRWFLPQLLWIGISIAIYSGLLVPIISLSLQGENNEKQFEKSMLAMVTFGVGEIVGGLVIGQVVDRKNSKIASLYNVGFVGLTTLMTLIYLSQRNYTWFVFFMAFLWGL